MTRNASFLLPHEFFSAKNPLKTERFLFQSHLASQLPTSVSGLADHWNSRRATTDDKSIMGGLFMKGIVWVIFSLLLVAGMPLVGMSADVNVNINVPPPPPPPAPPEAPPPLEFAAPPDVVVVPSGTASVYLVPNTVGLYFYGGYWYRSYRGSWFRASVYNGPWGSVAATLVPRPVFVIPPDYVLGMPPGYHHIHYHEFHSHWRAWDRQHYWHNQPWYRDHSQHHWGDRE